MKKMLPTAYWGHWWDTQNVTEWVKNKCRNNITAIMIQYFYKSAQTGVLMVLFWGPPKNLLPQIWNFNIIQTPSKGEFIWAVLFLPVLLRLQLIPLTWLTAASRKKLSLKHFPWVSAATGHHISPEMQGQAMGRRGENKIQVPVLTACYPSSVSSIEGVQ